MKMPMSYLPSHESCTRASTVRMAACRARMLSQGLVFLRAWNGQSESLEDKDRAEARLGGCALGDDFLLGAMWKLVRMWRVALEGKGVDTEGMLP